MLRHVTLPTPLLHCSTGAVQHPSKLILLAANFSSSKLHNSVWEYAEYFSLSRFKICAFTLILASSCDAAASLGRIPPGSRLAREHTGSRFYSRYYYYLLGFFFFFLSPIIRASCIKLRQADWTRREVELREQLQTIGSVFTWKQNKQTKNEKKKNNARLRLSYVPAPPRNTLNLRQSAESGGRDALLLTLSQWEVVWGAKQKRTNHTFYSCRYGPVAVKRQQRQWQRGG